MKHCHISEILVSQASWLMAYLCRVLENSPQFSAQHLHTAVKQKRQELTGPITLAKKPTVNGSMKKH